MLAREARLHHCSLYQQRTIAYTTLITILSIGLCFFLLATPKSDKTTITANTYALVLSHLPRRVALAPLLLCQPTRHTKCSNRTGDKTNDNATAVIVVERGGRNLTAAPSHLHFPEQQLCLDLPQQIRRYPRKKQCYEDKNISNKTPGDLRGRGFNIHSSDNIDRSCANDHPRHDAPRRYDIYRRWRPYWPFNGA